MDIPGLEYIVVCREDHNDDGSPGDYTLATRTVFPTKEAAEAYASGCASDRQAIVVGGRFSELRHDFEERFGSKEEDPVVAYQCAHYLTHETSQGEKWIGLYLTRSRQQAIYEACRDSGTVGFTATSSDIICVSVTQSELEAVKAKHTNIRTLTEWGS
jgi:hypothetical protein